MSWVVIGGGDLAGWISGDGSIMREADKRQDKAEEEV